MLKRAVVFSALALVVSFTAARGEVIYMWDEYDNGLVPGYGTTIDVWVDVAGEPEWDWLLSEVDMRLTVGEYYVHPAAVGMSLPARLFPPSGWAVMSMAEMAYTTHVGGPPMAEHEPGTGFIRPATPTAASFDVPSNQVFQMEIYDTNTEQDANFRLLRLTVSDGASGVIRITTNYDRTLDRPGGDVFGEWVTHRFGPGGIPPEADADGPYGRGDWEGKGALWNDPANFIVLDASGTQETDGDPILEYTWNITNTYDPCMPVTTLDANTDPFCELTIADLLADGELPPDEVQAGTHPFMVTVTARDKDGSNTSESTTLFVPEPATLVLLGLGGLAAIVRRRRR